MKTSSISASLAILTREHRLKQLMSSRGATGLRIVGAFNCLPVHYSQPSFNIIGRGNTDFENPIAFQRHFQLS